MNENMEIIVEVKNLISHSCILVRKIEVIDDKDNVIEVIEQNRDIQWEPEEALTHKFGWNTENNIAGKYNVRVTLGQQNKIIFSQVGSFEILGTDVTGYGITGALKVLTKEVDPSEDVDIKAELSNSGNADIIGAKSILSIIDSSKDEVIDTVVVDINLELGGYKSKNVTWKHDELESGEYQVKYQLELPNKKVIDLGSDSFTVIEKSIEPTPTPSIEPTDTGEDDDKPTPTPSIEPTDTGEDDDKPTPALNPQIRERMTTNRHRHQALNPQIQEKMTTNRHRHQALNPQIQEKMTTNRHRHQALNPQIRERMTTNRHRHQLRLPAEW